MAKLGNRLQGLARSAAQRNRAAAKLEGILREADALANSGKEEEALHLLERNLARFPNSADLRAALASLYGSVGRYADAAEQARIGIDLAPTRPHLRLLAAMAYEGAGYHSFAERERRIWLKTAPEGSLLPLMQELDAAFGASMAALQAHYGLPDAHTAERATLLLDEGRWALSHSRWSEALKQSRAASIVAPKWPPPRNNATVALIYLERYQEARDEARAVLRDLGPDNVHALANLVHMSVVLQAPEEAEEAADQLAAMPPRADVEELEKQIQGLTWLDRDADIDRLLKTARRKRLPIGVNALVHWGVAEANAGRHREALAHLREAEVAGVRTTLLLTTLEGIEARRPGPGISPRYPQTHFNDLLPMQALSEAAALAERQAKSGFGDRVAWEKLLSKYPQFPAAAERIMYEQADGAEPAAHILLDALGQAAKEALLRFVTGREGDDDTRIRVLHQMQEAGMIAADEPVEMWLHGKRQPVLSRSIEISDEFGGDYSEQAIVAYEQAAAAHARKDAAEAIRLYRLALGIEPKLKEAYNNLAVLLAQQGDTVGSQECLEKALAVDPLYPFPLVALALQALYREGPAAAKEILKPLTTVQRWRPLDMVIYQKGLAKIALEERDYETARNSIELARQLKSDDPELKDLMIQLETREVFDPAAGVFAGMDERNRERRRRKRLPADPTLADCLGILSVGDMVGIARTLDLWLPSPRLRALVEEEMLAQLQVPEVVTDAVGNLSEQESSALQAILDTGGMLTWEQFAERFGDESADRPYLEYWAELMKSVPGRLRARGLIYYGTIEGRQVVVIPRELRGLVADALKAAPLDP